jgi:hypothetical protein
MEAQMMDVFEDGQDTVIRVPGAGVLWPAEAMMELPDTIVDPETRGWHRYIAYQTTVLPRAVYFEGGTPDDRSMATLVVEFTRASLRPEPIRVPPPVKAGDDRDELGRAAEMFPERRSYAISEDELNAQLDELLFVPFRVVVVD